MRIAQNAHGYVGADLSAVCKEAGLVALKGLVHHKKDARDFSISLKDMDEAMLKVRPSAMRSINVDVPRVTWDDVGGQQEVKQRLKESIEWPLKYPEVVNFSLFLSNNVSYFQVRL